MKSPIYSLSINYDSNLFHASTVLLLEVVEQPDGFWKSEHHIVSKTIILLAVYFPQLDTHLLLGILSSFSRQVQLRIVPSFPRTRDMYSPKPAVHVIMSSPF